MKSKRRELERKAKLSVKCEKKRKMSTPIHFLNEIIAFFFSGKKGRRYNLVVHDDDNNDLSDLGLGVNKSEDDEEVSDEKAANNKDSKSDAGFCTGSDTGSDGISPEDNISEGSSAMVRRDILTR